MFSEFIQNIAKNIDTFNGKKYICHTKMLEK